MAHWQLTLLGIGCLMIALDFLIHVVYAFVALGRFEDRPPFQVTPPPETGPAPEPVTFPTSNQLQLRGGVYYPPDGNPLAVVIFCPETDARFQTALNYTPALLDAGFAVFSFDFRNQGSSDSQHSYRATHWLTEFEVTDVQAAINFIQVQPQFEGLPIGLFGVSRGGCAVLAAGAVRPEVQCVLAQGPFSTRLLSLHYSLKWLGFFFGKWDRLIPEWHVRLTLRLTLLMAYYRNGGRFVRLEALLPKLENRKLLIISGGRDSYVPEYIPKRLCQLTGHSPEDAHWVVPGAKHNMERQAAPQEFDEKVVQFFAQMLSSEVRERRIAETLAR